MSRQLARSVQSIGIHSRASLRPVWGGAEADSLRFSEIVLEVARCENCAHSLAATRQSFLLHHATAFAKGQRPQHDSQETDGESIGENLDRREKGSAALLVRYKVTRQGD